MGDSLKEQLLKLGLGTKKHADAGARNRAAGASREARQKRDAAPALPKTQRPSAPNARPAVAPSRTAAPSPPSQRQLDRERSARQARARERIEAHKLDDAGAEVKHYYSTGRKIKWLYVTEPQQAALLRGEIVIAIAEGKGRLVPASLVPSLRDIDPELRVVDPASSSETDGDPAHEVPDDLRW